MSMAGFEWPGAWPGKVEACSSCDPLGQPRVCGPLPEGSEHVEPGQAPPYPPPLPHGEVVTPSKLIQFHYPTPGVGSVPPAWAYLSILAPGQSLLADHSLPSFDTDLPDQCSPNPCTKEGTQVCQDLMGNFYCQCRAGWGGRLCDRGEAALQPQLCNNEAGAPRAGTVAHPSVSTLPYPRGPGPPSPATLQGLPWPLREASRPLMSPESRSIQRVRAGPALASKCWGLSSWRSHRVLPEVGGAAWK